MDKPEYRSKPIGSIAALALTLRVHEHALITIAERASSLYDQFAVKKKDGTDRLISNPRRELKFLQKRINRAIFGNVIYPDYLFGGIVDRDYVQNAEIHSDSKALIALDIENFYPSIRFTHVRDIFQNFCRFPENVAIVLAKLATMNDQVPQGACTSSHIANLVFYNVESLLVYHLNSKRLRYTRLLDDISISSPSRELSKKEVDDTLSRVSKMLKFRGMRLKSKKTRITTKQNPATLMEVTGLWLNRGRPRVKREERQDIRSDVRRVEALFEISRTSPEYHEAHDRVSGRVAKLSHLEHPEASVYRERLRKKLPHFSVEDQIHLRRQVDSLTRSKPEKRGTIEYISRYFQISYKLNILRRNNRKLSLELIRLMSKCRPTHSREEIIYG